MPPSEVKQEYRAHRYPAGAGRIRNSWETVKVQANEEVLRVGTRVPCRMMSGPG